MKKTVSILGATGSVGGSALTVAEMHDLRVAVITAGRNGEALLKAAHKFKPELCVIADKSQYSAVKEGLAGSGARLLVGDGGLLEAAAHPCDTLLNAVVGIAGLAPTVTAIDAKNCKNIALANKETLVAAGDIVMRKSAENGVAIVPVDSEHSAIFQCLQGSRRADVKKLILTASGGPFLGFDKVALERVTVEQALKHPNWSMGRKITIDSATMMNKALELIEAAKLFSMSADDIEVVVHPQSIVHSAVEYADNSVIAQLGTPDMAVPIQYAFTYPERYPSPAKSLSLTELGTLSFLKPDTEAFPATELARRAIALGREAVLNGANEVAVSLFLEGKITFSDICVLVENAVENVENSFPSSLEDVILSDKAARDYVLRIVESLSSL